jgi:beta-lactamase class A
MRIALRSWTRVLAFVAIFVLGMAAMATISWQRDRIRRAASRTVSQNAAHPVRVANNAYRFIDPLLGYDLPTRGRLEPYRSIRQDIDAAVTDAMTAHRAARASVYYRDLMTGSWFGVHAREQYAPASLAKVPLMIAYFKMAEMNPDLLQRRISFTRAHANAPQQQVVPEQRIIDRKSVV